MLTPADKLLTRANDIIQVVVTRRCDIHNCSNCSQLLPFRKDPTVMSLDCAEEALRSLEGWPGIVGMFGGNPCSHPQFEQLCELWEKHVPINQRGLWTNNLLDNGKTASQTFIDGVSRFNFNVHGNGAAAEAMRRFFPKTRVYGEDKKSVHGAVLGSHADYGVSEAEWVEARERCDINQKWSAGIYARDIMDPDNDPEVAYDFRVQKPYAYFCEVAGSIDGVTGENNGVPALKGWWRNPIKDFDKQVKRCCDRNCVVPLRYKGSVDLDFNYDVSKSVVQLTTDRVGKATVTCHGSPQLSVKELTDYQELRR